MTLAWDPSTSTNVAGYRIRYGFTNEVYPLTVEAGLSTSVVIDLPVQGTAYQFVATAYSDMGIESEYSNQVRYEAGGEAPTLVEQGIETLEDEPVALPWGADAGYTEGATWLLAIPPTRGWVRAEGSGPSYAPFQDTAGADAFTYFVLDGDRAYQVSAQVTVQPVNDAPWSWDSDVWAETNSPTPIELGAWDPDGDVVSFEVITAPRYGGLLGDGAERVYEPVAGFQGLDMFRYTVTDGVAQSQPATVWLWVGMPTGKPAVWDIEATTAEDQFVGVLLEGRDPDGDPLTFEVIALPQQGKLVGEGASWVYLPQPDFHGTDEFCYRASDGAVDSDPATVRIVVTPVNDPPVASDLDLNTEEDQAVALTFSAADVDGDVLSFQILTLPEHGMLNGEGGRWVYEPQANFHGSDEFQYVASDGVTNSLPATVRIVVAAVNDPPLVRGASYDVIEGVARDVILEGEDPDGDALTFRITQAPAHGTISGFPPQVSYEPETGYTGSDRWEFVASDGMLDSTGGVVAVEVRPKAAYETTLSVKAEDGRHWLSWGAVTGARYRLWQRRDMFEGDWVVIQEISAVGPEQETVTVLLPESEGYYRCEVLAY